MRILLLHPEDSPLDSRWSHRSWDLIVDLGWAGRCQYQEWKRQIECPIRALFDFADWRKDIGHLRQALEDASRRLVDGENIDWWNLFTPTRYQPLFEHLLMQKLAAQVGRSCELYVSRAHPLAAAAGKLLGTQVSAISAGSKQDSARGIDRYRKAVRTLTPKQVITIAGDKWDADYRFRRFIAGRRKATPGPTILLPSAYRNVSRIEVSYASLLADHNFLLVTTRRDGALDNLPRYVQTAPLAAYAPMPRDRATEKEIGSLTAQWEELRKSLILSEDPVQVYAASLFADLPKALRNGLRIRDAWRAVLDREPISAVLCGDEGNPYTRLPVLLAANRGIKTVHCSHGALDATIWTTGVCSDIYLVKGEMECDYLLGQCAVPKERIVIGAPAFEHALNGGANKRNSSGADIYFFSEPYELYYGRTELFYRELLPGLCQLARVHDGRVILKLHPFESRNARAKIVDEILVGADREILEISTEPMSEQLLKRIWFGVTVESSAAVECAVAGVPCFLCGWFDPDFQSYGKQYDKFGAAQRLENPKDIMRIPDLLESWPGSGVSNRLQHPITPEGLAQVLGANSVVRA